MKKLLLALVATAALAAVASDFPQVVYVSPTGSDATGDGTAENPYLSISNTLDLAGVAFADDGVARTVVLAAGTYTAADQDFPAVVPNGVSLKGAGMGSTILDAGNANRTLLQARNTIDAEIADISLRNSRGTILSFGNWGGTVRNVEIANCADPGSGNSTLYYSNGNNDREVVFAGLVMTNVTHSTYKPATLQKFFEVMGTGTATFTNCQFRNLTSNYSSAQSKGHFVVRHGNGEKTYGGITAKFTDTVFANLKFPGSTSNEGGIFMMCPPAGVHTFERCTFRDIEICNYWYKADGTSQDWSGNIGGATLLFAHHINADSTSDIRLVAQNCLFERVCPRDFTGKNVHRSAVLGGFRGHVAAYNCTFHKCQNIAAVTAINADARNKAYLRNSTFSEGGPVARSASNASGYVYLDNVNVYPDSLNTGYTGASSNITTENPYYADAENGDYHLTSRSTALIDAGNNAYVENPDVAVDFDRQTRIVDGGSGTATVDLGCYEYVPPQEGGDILFAKNVYGVFAGKTVNLTATLSTVSPLTEDLVATVTYSTNSLSGPATITFPVGTTSVDFTVSAASDAALPANEVATVTLHDSAGVLTDSVVDIKISEPQVFVDGLFARSLMHPDDALTYALTLESSDFTAPSAIPLVISQPEGIAGNSFCFVDSMSGTSSVSSIPAGASAAETALKLTCAATGATRVTLSVGEGFSFAGFGTSEVTLEILGYNGTLVVSPTGSDLNGDGSAEHPLGTIAFAASMARPGDLIRLVAGTYTATANGGTEVFPINVPAGVVVEGVPGETVLDPALTSGALFLGSETYLAPVAGGALRNLVIRNTNGAGIRSLYWNGSISNCMFTALSGAYNTSVGCYFEQMNGDVTLEGVSFVAITGMVNAAAHVSTRSLVNAPSGSAGSLVMKGCRFKDLSFGQSGEVEGGLVESHRPFVATDCVFEDIEVVLFDTTNAGKQSESRGLIQVYSGVENTSSIMEVDRCTFRRLSLGYNTLSMHFQYYNAQNAPMRVSNSLFHDITGSAGVIGDFRGGVEVSGCTFARVPSAYSYSKGLGASETVRFANSIISGATISSSPLTKDYYTLSLVFQSVDLDDTTEGYGYTTNLSANVMLVSPQFRNSSAANFHLKDTSPLINAGDNSYAVGGKDLDGNPRIHGTHGTVDIGCYEKAGLTGLVVLVR